MAFEERATAPVMSRRSIITLDFPGAVPAICRLHPADPATSGPPIPSGSSTPENRFVVRRELAPADAGVPMMLRVRVLDAVDRPLPGAVLEISHRAPGPADPVLSGAQVTDPHGYAEFKTVFPGWSASEPAGIDLVLYLAGSRDRGRLHFTGQVITQVAGLPSYHGNPRPIAAPEPPAGFPQVVPRDRYDLTAGLLATISAVTDR